MPTVLDDDRAYDWLFGDLNDDQITGLSSTQFAAKRMDACTFAKEFLSSLEPAGRFDYEDLPALEYSV